MPRSSGFWNLIAKNYTQKPIADEATYQRKLEMTRALLVPDMRVLEFGCGSANTAIAHAPHVAFIDAIDYSSKMVEIARKNVRDADVTNISVSQSTCQDWQPENADYDMVLALSVLHLLPDLATTLDKTRSLMRKGSYFVSSTVLMKEENLFARVILPVLGALRIVPYLSIFDEPTLVKTIEAAGFEIETNWRPRAKGSVFIVAKAI